MGVADATLAGWGTVPGLLGAVQPGALPVGLHQFLSDRRLWADPVPDCRPGGLRSIHPADAPGAAPGPRRSSLVSRSGDKLTKAFELGKDRPQVAVETKSPAP